MRTMCNTFSCVSQKKYHNLKLKPSFRFLLFWRGTPVFRVAVLFEHDASTVVNVFEAVGPQVDPTIPASDDNHHVTRL